MNPQVRRLVVMIAELCFVLLAALCFICCTTKKVKNHDFSNNVSGNGPPVSVVDNELFVDGVFRASIDGSEGMDMCVKKDRVIINGQTYMY